VRAVPGVIVSVPSRSSAGVCGSQAVGAQRCAPLFINGWCGRGSEAAFDGEDCERACTRKDPLSWLAVGRLASAGLARLPRRPWSSYGSAIRSAPHTSFRTPMGAARRRECLPAYRNGPGRLVCAGRREGQRTRPLRCPHSARVRSLRLRGRKRCFGPERRLLEAAGVHP